MIKPNRKGAKTEAWIILSRHNGKAGVLLNQKGGYPPAVTKLSTDEKEG